MCILQIHCHKPAQTQKKKVGTRAQGRDNDLLRLTVTHTGLF